MKKYYWYSNIGKSFDFVNSCESDCSLAAGMIMNLCLTFKIVHMMLLKLLVIVFSVFDVCQGWFPDFLNNLPSKPMRILY